MKRVAEIKPEKIELLKEFSFAPINIHPLYEIRCVDKDGNNEREKERTIPSEMARKNMESTLKIAYCVFQLQ